MPNPYTCQHCSKPLSEAPEKRDGDWIIPCLHCGAQNLITRQLALIGWRGVETNANRKPTD
jgi:DNA-directed RNA polymerase subunit RPC12/RpoP